ncbi:hypothetical protein C8R44DRAFT_753859 [Mycena epipterygia]|nr:hypothetical protein C8R44DRAFT_753859 [Mycena epipterygia]
MLQHRTHTRRDARAFARRFASAAPENGAHTPYTRYGLPQGKSGRTLTILAILRRLTRYRRCLGALSTGMHAGEQICTFRLAKIELTYCKEAVVVTLGPPPPCSSRPGLSPSAPPSPSSAQRIGLTQARMNAAPSGVDRNTPPDSWLAVHEAAALEHKGALGLKEHQGGYHTPCVHTSPVYPVTQS